MIYELSNLIFCYYEDFRGSDQPVYRNITKLKIFTFIMKLRIFTFILANLVQKWVHLPTWYKSINSICLKILVNCSVRKSLQFIFMFFEEFQQEFSLFDNFSSVMFSYCARLDNNQQICLYHYI